MKRDELNDINIDTCARNLQIPKVLELLRSKNVFQGLKAGESTGAQVVGAVTQHMLVVDQCVAEWKRASGFVSECDHTCSKCCCTVIEVSPAEALIASVYFLNQKDPTTLQSLMQYIADLKDRTPTARRILLRKCPFSSKDKGCKIYPIRPAVCKCLFCEKRSAYRKKRDHQLHAIPASVGALTQLYMKLELFQAGYDSRYVHLQDGAAWFMFPENQAAWLSGMELPENIIFPADYIHL